MRSAASIRRRAFIASHDSQCARRSRRAKAEPHSEATGESALTSCGYCGTDWLASAQAPTCPTCGVTCSSAHGERQ